VIIGVKLIGAIWGIDMRQRHYDMTGRIGRLAKHYGAERRAKRGAERSSVWQSWDLRLEEIEGGGSKIYRRKIYKTLPIL